MSRGATASGTANPVSAAFRETRTTWLHVGVFSAAVNLLMLTGSIYMLQVYDRVLTSRSIATLIGISLIVLAAYLLQGWLDALRLRMLVRNAATIDHRLFPLAARATLRLPLRGAGPAEALQPMRDLEALRSFLSGLGPTAFLDLPFLPLFLAATFLLHPMLGILATLGGLALVGLTLFVEKRGARLAKQLGEAAALRHTQMEAGRRNAEVVSALGMEGRQLDRLAATNARQAGWNIAFSDTTGGIGSAAKVFRMILQSAILGLGAWLVILNELSPGAMIGASILIGRALAPIESAVAYWKSFLAARQGLARLKISLPSMQNMPRSVALPPPRKRVEVTGLVVTAPGSTRALVQGASFSLEAGQSLGLIGPSGAGKSSLARAIAGVWPPAIGEIRFDGALADQWDRDVLGRSIGYLPQDVELFDGTIAENIARLEPDLDSEAVLRAAKAAGAHEMIVAMPQGYETRIGEGGAALSGGQRQRIALARALYRDPFLLVLDEPNSSLDSEGDEALTQALRAVRERGGIVIVVTHRPAGLAAVDSVAVLAGGRIRALGPRDEILKQVLPRSRPEIQGARPRKAAS